MFHQMLKRLSIIFAANLPLSVPAYAETDFPALEQEETKPQLALMGTIPIYWGEQADLQELLSDKGQTHWARPALERAFELQPLDFLSVQALAEHDYLLMAQPRALAGEENVALDEWVNAGGTLVLFADPMMTGESRFPLGDRRRPQDVALLSPILAHWGLELRFDDNQPAGMRYLERDGEILPLNMAGYFRTDELGEPCQLRLEAVVAQCALGEGMAVIFADAAMLDFDGPHPGAQEALEQLIFGIAPASGEFWGNGESLPESFEENDEFPTLKGMISEEAPINAEVE